MGFEGFTGKDGEPLAISVNLTRQFGPEGNATSWVTTLPQTASEYEMNIVVDKMARASERLELHSRISGMESEIAKMRTQILRGEVSIREMEKKHGDFSHASKQIKDQYEAAICGRVNGTDFIRALEIEQNRLKALLG